MNGTGWRRPARRPERPRVPDQRARRLLATALEHRAEPDRLVLALLLVERLSPAEAADALGISVARVRNLYRHTLEALGRVARGASPVTVRERARRSSLGEVRLRKAS